MAIRPSESIRSMSWSDSRKDYPSLQERPTMHGRQGLVNNPLLQGGVGPRDSFDGAALAARFGPGRSDEHTSELQALMRISYAVFCLNTTQVRISKSIDSRPMISTHI